MIVLFPLSHTCLVMMVISVSLCYCYKIAVVYQWIESCSFSPAKLQCKPVGMEPQPSSLLHAAWAREPQYSKWPQVAMMKSTTVPKTIDALCQIFFIYGSPEHIVSDNGPQFTSEEFAIFMQLNGIHHSQTAHYHSATNGLAERFVQSLKQGLKLAYHLDIHCLRDWVTFCWCTEAQLTQLQVSHCSWKESCESDLTFSDPIMKFTWLTNNVNRKGIMISILLFTICCGWSCYGQELLRWTKLDPCNSCGSLRTTVLPVGNDGQATLAKTRRPCEG